MIRAKRNETGRVISRFGGGRTQINPVELVQKYASTGLTGWALGVKHGQEEAAGTRAAPGAIRLGLARLMHGNSYVLGRQHALTKVGMHGGTRGKQKSIAEAVVPVLKELLAETP